LISNFIYNQNSVENIKHTFPATVTPCNLFSFLFQTIKCLLIVPNPESALNEEAGKLLLEQYDDYTKRAQIYTEIHAKPPK